MNSDKNSANQTVCKTVCPGKYRTNQDFSAFFWALGNLIWAITVDLFDSSSNAHRDSMKRGYQYKYRARLEPRLTSEWKMRQKVPRERSIHSFENDDAILCR